MYDSDYTPESIARFWALVEKTDTCWLWSGERVKGGYGRFAFQGQRRLAHRVSWELTWGPIPPDTDILHRCDNPPCVRPTDLFCGDAKINVADARTKGRWAVGERHSRSKITAEIARQIRDEYSWYKVTYRQLALKYGVSDTLIYDVVKGKRWVHIC